MGRSTMKHEPMDASHGERLDTRAASAASEPDSQLQAVAAIHRTANVSGEVHSGPQC